MGYNFGSMLDMEAFTELPTDSDAYYAVDLGQPSIEEFVGDYGFLDSMYVLENPVETAYGLKVPTTAHALHADSFRDPTAHEFIAEAEDAFTAQRRGRLLLKVGIWQRPDWGIMKLQRMYEVNRDKFLLNPGLAERLIATGDMDLVEGNSWNEYFWGVSPVGSRDGQNHLGRILMRIRHELQDYYVEELAA